MGKKGRNENMAIVRDKLKREKTMTNDIIS